jgi:hypothetical protein
MSYKALIGLLVGVLALIGLLIPFSISGLSWGQLRAETSTLRAYLPTVELNAWERLTPKQYLYLRYPEYATAIDRIISCESGWQPIVKNKHSSATGLCQFLDSTWLTTMARMGLPKELDSRLNPYAHIDACVWLFKTDGPRHWRESLGCHKVVK